MTGNEPIRSQGSCVWVHMISSFIHCSKQTIFQKINMSPTWHLRQNFPLEKRNNIWMETSGEIRLTKFVQNLRRYSETSRGEFLPQKRSLNNTEFSAVFCNRNFRGRENLLLDLINKSARFWQLQNQRQNP